MNILLVFNAPYPVRRGYDFKEEMSDPDNMYTEHDVLTALRANGHRVRLLGLFDDLRPFFEEIDEHRPDVVFNMVDMWGRRTDFDKNFAAVLEMTGLPFTGVSSMGLFVCNNKSLHKKILRYHRIRVPRFEDRPLNKSERRRLVRLPAVVKPVHEEASRGVGLRSLVHTDAALDERVRFVHERLGQDALVEEYIPGRELYVSVFGVKMVRVWPARELIVRHWPEDEPWLATYKAKWDDAYREKWGIESVSADLPSDVWADVVTVCRRAYRVLGLDAYARFDLRLAENGRVYLIEANANPCLAKIDEFACAAQAIGWDYNSLIQRILHQAVKRSRASH